MSEDRCFFDTDKYVEKM